MSDIVESSDCNLYYLMKEYIPELSYENGAIYFSNDFENYKFLVRFCYSHEETQATLDLFIIDCACALYFRSVLDKCFEKVGQINLFIRESNCRSLRFVRGIGFVETGLLKNNFNGEDLIIFYMDKEIWNNINDKI